MAVELSQICQAKLHLVMVIHELSTLPGEQAASAVLLPSATSALLDMDCEEGELYLVELMGKLLDKHIPVTGEVQRGDPAKADRTFCQRYSSRYDRAWARTAKPPWMPSGLGV